jgi:hypothetical protein
MTNRELQDLLKQYPDDEEVVIAQYHDYHDTIERVLEGDCYDVPNSDQPRKVISLLTS